MKLSPLPFLLLLWLKINIHSLIDLGMVLSQKITIFYWLICNYVLNYFISKKKQDMGKSELLVNQTFSFKLEIVSLWGNHFRFAILWIFKLSIADIKQQYILNFFLKSGYHYVFVSLIFLMVIIVHKCIYLICVVKCQSLFMH